MPGQDVHKPKGVRPANSYRGARKAEARKQHIIWRTIPYSRYRGGAFKHMKPLETANAN